MNLFTFHPQYQTLACKPCGYAITPSYLASHIRTKHPDDACCDTGLAYARAGKLTARLAMRIRVEFELFDPTMCSISVLPPTELLIPKCEI
jgi:hypothetical protein